MAPPVDLSDLQNAVGQVMNQHGLIVAAGPFTGAAAARIFFGKNKLITTAMTVGGAWMAVQMISGPMLQLMKDQFGYLSQLLEAKVARFIKISNKIVNLDGIAYVDFLESGRAMLLMAGLTQEKQNIPLDVEDARRLRAMLESELVTSQPRA